MGALKFYFATKEEIPAEVAQFYTERATDKGGGWVLNAEGIAEKSKVDELRNSNTALVRQMGELQAKFDALKDLDPGEYKRLKEEEEARKKKGKGAVEDEEFEAEVKKRTDKFMVEHNQKLDAAAKRAEAAETRLAEVLIDGALLEAAAKKGVKKTATDDVLARGRRVFKLKDNKPVAVDANGETIFGKDSNPLTVGEWIDSLAPVAPHLFEASQGGGATQGAGGARNGNGANPWSKEHFNVTEQGRIWKQDEALATRLAAQHGIKLKPSPQPAHAR